MKKIIMLCIFLDKKIQKHVNALTGVANIVEGLFKTVSQRSVYKQPVYFYPLLGEKKIVKIRPLLNSVPSNETCEAVS